MKLLASKPLLTAVLGGMLASAVAAGALVATRHGENDVCPDVAIVGARGSGEPADGNGLGPMLNTFADEVVARVPANMTVKRYGVPYLAVDAAWAALSVSPRSDISVYNASVLGGASLLNEGSDDYQSLDALIGTCPRAALILTGLSQGAQVVTTALAQRPLSRNVRTRLAMVALFASPVRVLGEPIDVGATDEDGVLADAPRQPNRVAALIPQDLWGLTRSYCLKDDPICDNTNALLLTPGLNRRTTIHSSYADSIFVLQAADQAVSEVARVRDQAPTANSVLPAPQTYVALGDSYSAGEGTNDYFAETQSGDDSCHRSGLSYASMLGASRERFVACSGATTTDIENGFKTELSQLSTLDQHVDLVTITAGGNDLGFSNVLKQCVWVFLVNMKSDDDCSGAIREASGGIPTMETNLTGLLERIHAAAPSARVLVLGYPRLFPHGGTGSSCSYLGNNRQIWLNDTETLLNQAIESTTIADGAEYIDVTDTFNGHELCTPKEYINEMALHCIAGNGAVNGLICSESFHPDVDGYVALRDAVFDRLDQDLKSGVAPPRATTTTTGLASTVPGTTPVPVNGTPGENGEPVTIDGFTVTFGGVADGTLPYPATFAVNIMYDYDGAVGTIGPGSFEVETSDHQLHSHTVTVAPDCWKGTVGLWDEVHDGAHADRMICYEIDDAGPAPIALEIIDNRQTVRARFPIHADASGWNGVGGD